MLMEITVSKPKKKASVLIIAALIAVVAVGIIVIVSVIKNSPYAELKAALNDGSFSSNWRSSNNQRVVTSSDKKAVRIVADKISEYHTKNEPENALKLLNDLLEFGIELDGQYYFASSGFIDWIKNYAETNGEGGRYEESNYQYTVSGYSLRWNSTMLLDQFYIYVPFLNKECIVMVNNTFYKIDPSEKVWIK